MRFGLALFIALILITIAATPLLEGYLFREAFYQQIAYYQDELKRYPNARLYISRYRLGWLTSNATLSLDVVDDKRIPKQDAAPTTIEVNIQIQHGPFIYRDGQWVRLFAYLESTMELPDALKSVIQVNNPSKPLVQINSAIEADKSVEKSTISIQPVTIAGVTTWSGLSGNLEVLSANHKPVAVTSKLAVGEIQASQYSTTFNIGKSAHDLQIKQEADGLWSGISKFTLTNVNILNPFAKLGLTNLTQQSTLALLNGKYNYDMHLTIQDLQLPINDNIFSNISDIDLTFALNNMNAQGLSNFDSNINGPRLSAFSMQKILTDTSNLQSHLSFKTKAGDADISVDTKLKNRDATIFNLDKYVDFDLKIKIYKSLLEAFLAYSTRTYSYQERALGSDTSPANNMQAKKIINEFMKQGLLTESGNYYFVNLTYKNSVAVLNDKQVELAAVGDNIGNAITDSYLACYTKANMNDAAPWTKTDIDNSKDCYAKDSCFRGLGSPDSGCYKWARSAYDTPQPWTIADSDSTSAVSKAESMRAYLTSNIFNTISVCDIDSLGTFINCGKFKMKNPTFILLNKKGNKAVIPHLAVNDYVNCNGKPGAASNQCQLTICNINSNGSPYHCLDNNIAGDIIDSVIVEANGDNLLSIKKGSSSYTVCSIKSDNTLGDCSENKLDPSIISPQQIETSKDKSVIYFLNNDSSISSCRIQQDGSLTNCKKFRFEPNSFGNLRFPFTVNAKRTHVYKITNNTLAICALGNEQSVATCTNVTLKAANNYTDYSNVNIDDDDHSIFFSSPTNLRLLTCHLNGSDIDINSCNISTVMSGPNISSMYLIGSIRPKSVIKSVTFSGDAVKPIITVTGSGFNPRPTGGRASSDPNALDYGKALHFLDNATNPNPFSAGYNDEQNGRHDAIGLIITKYTDTAITLTFGSDYDTYYRQNVFKLNEGDNYTMYVYDAMYSGTVAYQNGNNSASSTSATSASQANGIKVKGTYFVVPGNHPDVEHGLDNLIPGMVEPKLGPHNLPVASSLGRSGRVPSGAITDLNSDGEIMWWSPSANNGITVDTTVEGNLPLNNQAMYPSGRNNDNGAYRSAHYHGTFTLPKKSSISLSLGSDDDSWVFIDGKLAADAGGVKIVKVQDYLVEDLAAGKHTLDIFYIDRHTSGAGITFYLNTSIKSPKEKEADEQNW